MNTLADRLDRLAERGPRADARLVVARATAVATGTALADEPAPRPPRWPSLVAAAAAAVVVAVAVLVAMRPAGEQASAPGAGSPATGGSPPAGDAEPLAPAATLPPSGDVSSEPPVTWVGTGPTQWYRLQPDLDVAWYSPNDGTSMLCLRTPTVPASCQPDEFAPTAYGGGPIGIATAGDQVLVLTLDPGDTITLGTSAGTDVTVPVARNPEIGWGVARVPAGGELVGLTAFFPAGDATTAGSTPGTGVPTASVPGLAGSHLPPGLADVTTSVETDASRRFAGDVTAALARLGWDAEPREHATRTTRDGVEVQWVYVADGPDRRLFVVAGGPDLGTDWSVGASTVAEYGDATRTLIAVSEPVDTAEPRSSEELTALLAAML